MAEVRHNFTRFLILLGFFSILVVIMIVRLFVLQVMQYDHYKALASGQYEVFKELFPERGNIYTNDNGQLYPIALNRDKGLVFAQPNIIKEPDKVAESLYELLAITDEAERAAILEKLKKADDPYEIIKKNLDEEVYLKVKDAKLEGIFVSTEKARYYPEKEIFCHLTGFLGKNDNEKVGQYGLEAYFDEELRGVQGYLDSEKDALGRWIVIAKRQYVKPENGKDVKITINKAIQLNTREMLKNAVETYEAESGTVIIVEPQTGAILSMVNYPDYNPNEYYNVEDYQVYNNHAVSTSYEPGSIFKAITLAAALDVDKITPDTMYEDKGVIEYDDGYQKFFIYNANKSVYGWQSMSEVLQKSLNTGTIYAMQQMGTKKFQEYMKSFGFGELTGIELNNEKAGDISSLDKSLNSKGEIFAATATYGQGIMVTPLQMVMAVNVLANGGKLMKPYLVEDIIGQDGTQHFSPQTIRQVISPRAATLITGMMVATVDKGHEGTGSRAKVPGYYLAGKTGTAEVAERGVYGNKTIHSYIGYGPADNPKFTILIKLDNPQKGTFAESTAAILFNQISQYLLDYFHIQKQY
ncbi:MAG TPA: penicillin-binding protein 2 [bacterium]|nr:penicillin-binding protein 2 [bacterium]